MTPPRPPISDEAAEAAAAWRARLDNGDAGEADWLAYEQWLAASPEHRAATDAIDIGIVDAQLHREAVAPTIVETRSNVVSFAPKWTSRPAVWASATAAIAACALLAVWAWPTPPRHFAYAASLTRDQQFQLPDGSTLHLNRGASVKVSYGRERRIELERGEAAFSVRHDPSHPFEVAIGQTQIRDIGTEFNVARNPASVVVTVRSGEIEVATPSRTPERLRAGLGARISATGIEVAPASVDAAFAWQSGQLVYQRSHLSAVVEDLNRYSATPIVLDPSVASDLHFDGTLTIDTPEAMLARLQSFLPIRAKREGDRIVVRSAS